MGEWLPYIAVVLLFLFLIYASWDDYNKQPNDFYTYVDMDGLAGTAKACGSESRFLQETRLFCEANGGRVWVKSYQRNVKYVEDGD